MRLASLQVGKPRVRPAPAADGKPWKTGYGKSPVDGPVVLRTLNLDGDGQADGRWHGGPDMAVLAYAASHYPLWRAELDWPALAPGAFAENFTVDGADEAGTCIGDRWEVGEALLEVSEPRKPCRNIARFWGRDDLLRRVESTGRTGWYLRVLREGRVAPGEEIRLARRPHPEWSIAAAVEVNRNKARDRASAARLADCPALGAQFRDRLRAIKAKG
ncbi:MAG: MOSC domain-containing protein [Myxococcales bacterium]